MTTLNGAQFLGREATMGTVDPRKNADLILLDSNPIADVANLDKISAVFLKGNYYSRVALDKLLSDVVAACATQRIKERSTILDPTHLD
jgi:cytosine/adenosine deaminase-related metal-dependent hydrolase